MINISEKLPDRFMKVKCTHKSNPSFWTPSMVYWFYPCDKSFRTNKNRNRTNKLARWEEF